MRLDRKAKVRWQSALCASFKGLNFILRKLQEDEGKPLEAYKPEKDFQSYILERFSLGALWRLDLKEETQRQGDQVDSCGEI